ncbi:MAG: KH domain-containing protein [Desulfobulbaceae bacterium]|uniref:RNA-binding protein KhpA n=1 Tax=Candidatus Desulfatifera sulfidica TaxID=2841691 RepID=A0A8J6N7N8_9BACT|nr:KH domain-containing protein [Candidatus Desulfatifera sulfidica]
MKELITFIARSLVDDPNAVTVTERQEEDTVILELAVAKPDLGKVIGKQGRTARAMRTLLATAAGKENKGSRMDILE